ncbi:Golgi apyrase [Sporothrix bragantina]|uniref:Golgi apyrase n=1 Tax=Sporothrix bragantina TaxID=671064 RepID=A0ABP0BMV2_9PEZI
MSSAESNDEKPVLPLIIAECITESPDSSRSSSRCSSPTPTLLRGISFPLAGSDRSACTSPTPSIMSMTESEWLDDIRTRSFNLYRLARRKPITMVKPRLHRVPLEVDDDDDDDVVKSLATVDEDSDEDFDEVLDGDGLLKVSENDEAAAATRVSMLFQRLSMSISAHEKPKLAEEEEEPKPIDWNAPGQLEEFLERCVEGWEIQNQYLVQQKRMLRAMEKLCKRINAAEDENALLAWYANHLKGGSTAPITADTATLILQEAQAAVVNIASASMEAPKPLTESTESTES